MQWALEAITGEKQGGYFAYYSDWHEWWKKKKRNRTYPVSISFIEGLICGLESDDLTTFWDKKEMLSCVGETGVEPLIDALGYGDENVRSGAAFALGNIGDRRAVQPLIQALADSSCEVREYAAGALGRIGDTLAVEPLIEVIDGSETTCSRSDAVEALGRISDPRVNPVLITALQDESSWVRRCAARALGTRKEQSAVEPLLKLLEDDDFQVREAAAQSLAALGDERAVEPLTQSLLKMHADTGNSFIGYEMTSMIKSLVSFDSPKVVPALIDLADDVRWHVRSEALQTLKKQNSPQVRAALIEASRDSTLSSNVKKEILELLGETKADASLDVLMEAFEDPYQGYDAGDALVKIGGPAVRPLVKKLDITAGAQRERAAYALGEIGDFRAVRPLIETLADERLYVKHAAADALWKITGRYYGYDEKEWRRWWRRNFWHFHLTSQLPSKREIRHWLQALKYEFEDWWTYGR